MLRCNTLIYQEARYIAEKENSLDFASFKGNSISFRDRMISSTIDKETILMCMQHIRPHCSDTPFLLAIAHGHWDPPASSKEMNATLANHFKTDTQNATRPEAKTSSRAVTLIADLQVNKSGLYILRVEFTGKNYANVQFVLFV